MSVLFTFLLLACTMTSKVVYDFSERGTVDGWVSEHDVVMGGRSSGSITMNSAGFAEFSGEVSLENNGGFAQVKYGFEPISVEEYGKVKIRVKGDGKRYQFRLKDKKGNRHSYIYYFTTSGEWEDIYIPLNEMKPTFRGRDLDMPNFNSDELREVSVLIGNKKAENFVLAIKRIELVRN